MKSSLCFLAGVAAWAVPALAGTNGFTVPTFRGQPASTVAGWESFTVATDNLVGNAPDLPGSTATARILQFDPNAVILGSGNLYNQNHVSRFQLRYSAADGAGLVVLQMRTLGNELSYDSVRLTYDLGAGPVSLGATREELSRVSLGPPGQGPGGSAISSRWTWDISAAAPTSYTISFQASDVSLSLDSATLDTLAAKAVPEPGTWALLGTGAAALALAGWRRR